MFIFSPLTPAPKGGIREDKECLVKILIISLCVLNSYQRPTKYLILKSYFFVASFAIQSIIYIPNGGKHQVAHKPELRSKSSENLQLLNFHSCSCFNTNKSGLEFKLHSYPGLLRIKTKSAPFSIASLYATQ